MAFLFLDRRNVAIGSVLLAVIFSLGVIIGYYSKQEPSISRDGRANEFVNTIVTDQFLKEKDLINQALESVDSNKLRSYLKELTKEPHIAGHRRDNELIEYIRKTWIDIGLDHVELAEYDFYLSWPNQVNLVPKFSSQIYAYSLICVSLLSSFEIGFTKLKARILNL